MTAKRKSYIRVASSALMLVLLGHVSAAWGAANQDVYWVETDGLVRGLWRVDTTLPPATYPVVADLFIDCIASACFPFAVAHDDDTNTIYMSTLGFILSKNPGAALADPFATVVSGLGSATPFFINDIAVGGGFLYIAQLSRLLRYNIDGTNQLILDDSLSHYNMKLDSTHGRIYWHGGTEFLHRMNTDGSGSIDTLSFLDVDDPANANFFYRVITIDAFAFDVENNLLYFQSQDRWNRKSDGANFAIRKNLRIASIDFDSTGSVALATTGFLIQLSGGFGDLEIDLEAGDLYFTGKPTPSAKNSTWRIDVDGTNLEQLSFDYGIRDDAGQRRRLALATKPAPLPFGGPLAAMLLITGLIGAAAARLAHTEQHRVPTRRSA